MKSDHINVFSAAVDAESANATLVTGPRTGRSTADAPAQQEMKTGPAELQRLIAHEIGHGIDYATSSKPEFNAEFNAARRVVSARLRDADPLRPPR